MRRLLTATAFVFLLMPSLWFAWQNRAMPQLGESHDDAIYLIVSKAVAEGHGYRIMSLPNTPYETKYPPLLIWSLAAVWRMNPRFPGNLTWVTALQWAMIPPFLGLALVWLRRVGLAPAQRWIALAILAVSPYTMFFSAAVSTEALYALLLLAALIACDEARAKGWRWAAAGGVLAGLGYLTRTAGIGVLVAIPAVFLLWRKRREAAAFALAMLPFVAAWMAWCGLHRSASHDLTTMYNTDYLRFELLNVHPADLAVVVWTNLGHMLYGIGALAFPLELDSMLWQLLRITVGVGILAGIVRHWRNPVVQLYLAVGFLDVAELLVWHFPPNLRLMYSLTPLLVSGLIWEGEHLFSLVRTAMADRRRSQRRAAWILGGATALAAAAAVSVQGDVLFHSLPDMIRSSQRQLAEEKGVYDWVNQHAEPGAAVYASNPSLYLYTGRRTAVQVILPIYWYRGDNAAILRGYGELPRYVAENGFRYLYIRDSDYERMLEPAEAAQARREFESNPAFRLVFRSGDGSVFEARQFSTQNARTFR